MRHHWKLGLLIMIILAWLGIALFGWQQQNGSSSSANKTVTLGYQKADPIDIAKQRGEFAKALKAKGYKVVFKEFQDGSSLMQALKSGNIDYARLGDTPPVTAAAAGTKLTYIAAGSAKANGSAIVVKRTASMRSLKDLKGKRVAYTKGTSSQYLLLRALKKAGLSADDITWVNLDQSAASVAFSKGKVDAWATWDPYTASAQLQQNAKVLTNGNGLSNNRDFIVASTGFAKQNKTLSKYIIKYLSDDMTWADTHHKALAKMMEKSLQLPEKVILKMITRRHYTMTAMTDKVTKEEQEIADLFYSEGVIKKKITIKNAVQKLE